MIRIDEDYIIDVDAYNYSPKEIKKSIDKETGEETGKTYEVTIGHYSSLENAIKGILNYKAMKYAQDGEKSLYDVLVKLQTYRREFDELLERAIGYEKSEIDGNDE